MRDGQAFCSKCIASGYVCDYSLAVANGHRDPPEDRVSLVGEPFLARINCWDSTAAESQREYQTQVKLIDLQMRLLIRRIRQEDDAAQEISEAHNHPLHKHREQLLLLERQSMKRYIMARHEMESKGHSNPWPPRLHV